MSEQPDPDRVRTRAEFGAALTALRESAGLTVRELAARAGMPAATVGGYLVARHLPSTGQLASLRALLAACGVAEPEAVARWGAALLRARTVSDARIGHSPPPYPGLEPFGPDDATRFFGRERAVAQVVVGLQRLVAAGRRPLLAVVGPSGSGKSSLLRAGVVPAVAGGGLDARLARWAVITPGDDPLAALEPVRARPPRLLVVDQFEELFTLCRDDSARVEFLATLTGFDPAITVAVAGLRADFYAAATREPLLVPTLEGAQVVLAPMRADELRAAIVGPARQAGATVEEGLVELLLSELGASAARDPAAEPGPDGSAHSPGALPLLSHALLATWNRAQRNQLTVADYRASGGLHGAVAQTAEDTYRALDPRAQDCARRVFCRLVTVGEYAGPTRRQVGWAELDALADASTVRTDDAAPDAASGDAGDDVVRAVVGRFVAQRLLTADTDTVQVSHEALPVAWPRLREWLDADREGLFLHRRLIYDANAWAATDHDPGALLSGTRLDRVAEWAAGAEHIAALNRTERDFVAAALAQRTAEQQTERRRARRLKQLLAAVAVLAVVAGLLAGYSWHARSVADTQRSAANQARDGALSRQVALQATRLRSTEPALAAQLALAAHHIAHTPQATAALLDTSALPSATRLRGPAGAMQALAVDPAGTLLAATGADGQVHLWTLHEGGQPTSAGVLPVQPLGQNASTLFAVAFSPDGRLLATGGADRTVELWDVSDPAHPHRDATLTGPTNTVYALAFSPDGTTLAAGSADRLVHRWSVHGPDAPTPLPSLSGADGYVQSIAFGPHGDTLAAGTAAGSVDVWTLAGPTPGLVATEHVPGGQPVYSIAIDPAGTQLAAADADDHVYRWGVANPARPVGLAALTGFASWVNALTYSADGRYLAAGSSDQTVRIWAAGSGRLTRVITAANVVTALAFLPGSTRLAGATNEGTALIWPVVDPVLTGSGHVFSVSTDASGRLLAAGASDDSVRLWRTGTTPATQLPQVSGPAGTGPTLDGTSALSPNGRLLAAGTSTGPVLLWDLSDPSAPRLLATLRGPTEVDEYVTFSPDGQLLAAAGNDGTVHLWDVADPRAPTALPTLTGLGGYVYNIAFSPDAQLLAAPTAADTVSLWDLHDPRHPHREATVAGFGNYAFAAAFTPDGRTLAVGSGDKTVRLYDVSDPTHPRRLGAPLSGPTGYVYDVAIDPAGRLLAAASLDGTVWLWDIADPARPRLVADLTASGGSSVYAVAFAPDGHTLTAGSADGSVHRWDTDPAAVAAQVCARSGAGITPAEWREYVPGPRYRPPCG